MVPKSSVSAGKISGWTRGAFYVILILYILHLCGVAGKGAEMTKKNLAGSISYVTVIMLFARFLSLASTQVYLAKFGTASTEINIYSYAISVPNILFTCLGTALSAVVIPIYAGRVARGETALAKRFGDNMLTVSTLLTSVLVVLGIGLSFLLPKFTAFREPAGTYWACAGALMTMMPAMLFYAWNYVFQGMLQSNGKYGWPAFVSVPSSLIVMGYVVFFADRFGVPGLLIATLLGLAAQALILVPPLLRTGYRYRPVFDLKDPDLRSALRMSLPVLIGVSAYQVNMFYNNTVISHYEGMVTLLTYVQNLVIYLVLAFVYSVTAVLYPRLSAAAAREDMAGYKSTLAGVLNAVLLLLLPVTFGFIAVRTQLLDLIARWGKITPADVRSAGLLLAMYALGIVGIGFKEILDRAFYALKETRISAWVGVLIMGVNIALSLVLMRIFGPYGLPLAYSIASLAGAGVLLARLRRRIGPFLAGTFAVLWKGLVASGVMFGVVLFLNALLARHLPGDGLALRCLKLALPVTAGVLVYGGMLLVLRVPMALRFMEKLRRKAGVREEGA